MKINVSAILKREAEEKARVKPLPKIRVGIPLTEGAGEGKPKGGQDAAAEAEEKVSPSQRGQGEVDKQAKDQLLLDLRNQFAQMKRDRGKLSTHTAWLVFEIEQKLLQESPAMAKAFADGNLAMPELAEHYAKIEALTDKGAMLYEQIEHVERYGVLPSVPEKRLELRAAQASADVNAIKYEIRRLDDLIHKKMKNIAKANAGIKTPKNTGRPAQWREMIALADARREELKQQLKRINYEAREQRFSSAQG